MHNGLVSASLLSTAAGHAPRAGRGEQTLTRASRSGNAGETRQPHTARMTSTAAAAALTGYTVAITDSRLRDVAAELRALGASTVDIPLLQIVPGHLDGRLRNATRRLIRDPADHVVVTGGPGWLRWLAAAAAWGLSDALTASLRRATILSLSPPAGEALRQTRFRHVSVSNLDNIGGYAARVAITADEPPPLWLLGPLRGKDIDVLVLPTLRWAPPTGLVPLHRLARMVIQREVHAVAFATATVAKALVDVTARTGRRDLLLRALATDVAVAAADAESAAPFLSRDIPVHVAQEGLARLILGALLTRRREFRAGGRHFAVQGDVVLGGDVALRLPPRPATVMRSLADHPGRTLSRAELEQLAPLSSPTGVEHAVRLLRAGLGEYAWLVATVHGRGYRLAID